jgi:SAM-dependent methyltransferase
MSFKDHFSGHAASYAAYRPGYPPRLFEILAALSRERRLAWDSGTGNGQAAVALADHFDCVVATDPSAEQIAHALPHPRVDYRVGRAEDSGLAEGSVDLVTAAQALHWYDFDRFYAEARRVLAPGGVVAVWTYNLARVDPEVDRWTDRLAQEIVGPWWPPERRWVDEEYQTLPFPFDEIEIAPLRYEVRMDLDRLTSYFRTWSSFQRYQKETGRDPLDEIREGLTAAWGDPAEERTVHWPIFIRAGHPQPSSGA